MEKCSACQFDICQLYKGMNLCIGRDEGIECACICQQPKAKKTGPPPLGTRIGVAAGGLALAGGGVALTALGAPVVAGAALVGAGTALVMDPIQKTLTGEGMNLKDTAADVALGAVIGNFREVFDFMNSLINNLVFYRCCYWSDRSWSLVIGKRSFRSHKIRSTSWCWRCGR